MWEFCTEGGDSIASDCASAGPESDEIDGHRVCTEPGDGDLEAGVLRTGRSLVGAPQRRRPRDQIPS
jgi:hypothetical protein